MPEPGDPARDRANPSIWDALRADPTLQFDRRAIELLARDQQRWTRRYLQLPASVASRVMVAVICLLKRLLPFQFAAHATMDRLCVWFLRRFVSPEAVELLVRHFIVETNLLNVIADNSGPGDIARVELLPTRLAELGDGAVIQHDLNVYNLVIDLGEQERTTVRRPRGPAELNLSALEVPSIDPERETRRFLNLDIETALCCMNIPFALCLTAGEYRRAVHSLRLDETLLACLAELTGDLTFRTWRPEGFTVQPRTARDVPRAVYAHAVICEYAHARLRELRDGRGPSTPALPTTKAPECWPETRAGS
jgi:hypothetical protein